MRCSAENLRGAGRSIKLFQRQRVVTGIMKTILLALSLAAAGVSSAHAQLFQPTLARDTVLGAVAGALIGGHNHDRWAEGAAIGAAAGALVGATVDQPRAVVYRQAPVTVITPAPVVAQAPQVVYVEPAAPVRVVRVVQPAPVVYYAPAPVVVVAPTRYYVSPRSAYGYRGGRYWR
jgi:hypothetical protein